MTCAGLTPPPDRTDIYPLALCDGLGTSAMSASEGPSSALERQRRSWREQKQRRRAEDKRERDARIVAQRRDTSQSPAWSDRDARGASLQPPLSSWWSGPLLPAHSAHLQASQSVPGSHWPIPGQLHPPLLPWMMQQVPALGPHSPAAPLTWAGYFSPAFGGYGPPGSSTYGAMPQAGGGPPPPQRPASPFEGDGACLAAAAHSAPRPLAVVPTSPPCRLHTN